MTTSTDISAIILASGKSSRMGNLGKKEYLPLGTGTVLSASVSQFLSALGEANILIVIPSLTEIEIERATAALFIDERLKEHFKTHSLNFLSGGEERADSVRNALEFLDSNSETFKTNLVLIHDAARPFLSADLIKKVVSATREYGAATPGTVPTDTMKVVNESGFIETHLERERVRAVETPQGFLYSKLLVAHRMARAEHFHSTDDTAIWGKYVGRVKVITGERENKKITFPSDYLDCK